ncbi:Mitochondrial proton/calcium exchanger protein (Leucine zipper-EF-hand-containing transmembrane protein 1) [Durusdinium trenchii]|uniref:Mitochondrial proton/calcium exchanger protein n=1 Tax=Durusdinium trenchii TaxID=1381693 RepID=A0ABP0K1W4_9DINO
MKVIGVLRARNCGGGVGKARVVHRRWWAEREWGWGAATQVGAGRWDDSRRGEEARVGSLPTLWRGDVTPPAILGMRNLHSSAVLLEAARAGLSVQDDVDNGLAALKDAKVDLRTVKKKDGVDAILNSSGSTKPQSGTSGSSAHGGQPPQASRQQGEPGKPGGGKKKKGASSVQSTAGSSKPMQYARLAGEWTWWLVKATGSVTLQFLRNPLIVKKWGQTGWSAIKDMAHHTWTGFKLLGVEVRTSWNLVMKRLNGHQLTRRERRQLVRTTADLARVVPFMFFILVPFMEFLLPVALKVFPNMLPSTFQDSYKTEENMKRQLKLRIEMASFLQEMVVEMEDKVKNRSAKDNGDAISVDDVQLFMERVRMGRYIDDATTFKVAKLFSDELTSDNMSRSQLVTLCKYMGLTPYGGDQFLRFQLRSKINSLREDDASIYFEGVEALNLLELKQACEDRGMRATGLTMHQLRTQLKRWIDLSVNQNVPLSLLILSRAFTLQHSEEAKVELAISEAISEMDSDVLQEALIAGAQSKDVAADQATLSMLKLEAIQAQNELIEAEIREKARKQQFLQQLREKAEAELAAASVPGEHMAEVEEAVEQAVEAHADFKEVSPEVAATLEAAGINKDELLHVEDGTEPSKHASREHDVQPATEEAQPSLTLVEAIEEERAKVEENRKVFEDTLESIKVLAANSPVEEEKHILDEILEKQEELDAAKAVKSGRIVKTTDDPEGDGVGVAAEQFEPERRTRSLLKNRVKKMLEKLEVDVEETNEKIGSKLRLLDLDKDGKVSNWEVRKAIQNVLAMSDYSEEKADELIQQLDLDGDGIISLDELSSVLEQLKEERRRSEGE